MDSDLDELLDEATLDCYGIDEQLAAIPSPATAGAVRIAAYKHGARGIGHE